jgi:hypothetical protein
MWEQSGKGSAWGGEGGQIFEIDIKRKRRSDQVLIRTIKETISSNSGTYF